ncbi:MAG: gamma-glutamyl-gamma-aminobutyrate hydrolase family protein [Bacteroidales bacterium]
MEKVLISLSLFLCIIGTGNVSGQKYFETPDYNPEYSHLILTHPTVNNMKTFLNLVSKDLVELENTRIIGVFYQHGRYDYDKTKDFIDTCSSLPVEVYLHEVADSVGVEELYQNNELSDDFETIFQQSEGVIFFGGPDMPPSAYGKKTNFLTSIYDPGRHFFELSFLYHLTGGSQDPTYQPLLKQKPGYIIYGFCLGMQTMNVAAGGNLTQDIPTEIYDTHVAEDIIKMDENFIHRNYYRHIHIDEKLLSGSFHQVKIKEGCYLEELSEKTNPWVYSNHHQCINELGMGYQVIAHSMDQEIIEAFRHNDYRNVIGVQFHPEAMRLFNDDIEFRTIPGEKLQCGRDILEETESMQFHKAFWNDFSERFKNRQ